MTGESATVERRLELEKFLRDNPEMKTSADPVERDVWYECARELKGLKILGDEVSRDKTATDATLDELVSALEKVVHFKRREDYVLLLLWAAQSRLGREVLPRECCAYLSFTGPRSAGKTTATKLATFLAGGIMLAGGTEAAIRSILAGKPKALGIDEVDIRMLALPDLEGILRVGSDWDAKYPLRVPGTNGRGWATDMQDIGGPKVFNYRSDPEDALASRTIGIEMEAHRDARMVVEGLFGFEENTDVAFVKHVLESRGEATKERWSTEALKEHMLGAEFVARVDRLVAHLPRGLQIGAVLLAVSDAMGFDVESVIAKYVAEQREDSLQAEKEILSAIYEEHEADATGGELRLLNADVQTWLNQRRRDRLLRAISPAEWRRVQRELRIGKVRGSRGMVLVFGSEFRRAVGLESSGPANSQATFDAAPAAPGV